MNERCTNQILIQSLFKNPHKIIWTSVFFAITTTISLCLTKKYKSSGIVYPVSMNNSLQESNNPFLGREKDADLLVQLFESSKVFDMVTHRNGLADLYQIDTADVFWYDKLMKAYNSDISIS